MARVAEAEADKAASISKMMTAAAEVSLPSISINFQSITAAVKNLDTALGRGKKRIEIISVLETLSSIKGDDISSTVLSSGVNKLQVSAKVNNPKNYMPENFDITVHIGRYQFEPVVQKIISRYAKQT